MNVIRHLTLATSGSLLRTAKYCNRDHLVVPVVALVEGVIQAVNASAPEYVPAGEISNAPQGWNGRPVLPLHPAKGNVRVSANDPEILAAQKMGEVFHATFDGGKLKMEAWIDKVRAAEIGGDAQKVVDRLEAGQMVEVSVGAFVNAEAKEGVHNGKAYKAVWQKIVPDHLALLPEGTLGACSNKMGCGAPRTASQAEGALTAAGGPGSGNFGHAGPQKTQFDVKHLEADMSVVRSLDASYDDLRRALTDKLREATSKYVYIESVLLDDTVVYSVSEPTPGAVEVGKPTLYFRQSFAKNTNTGEVSLLGSPEEVKLEQEWKPLKAAEESTMFERLKAFFAGKLETLEEFMTAKGARNSAKDQETIQAVHDHTVLLGAACRKEEPQTAQAEVGGHVPADQQPDAGTSPSQKENQMKDQLIAALIACSANPFTEADKSALETMSEDRLTALAAHFAPKAPEAPKTPEAPKPLTEEQFLASAPESIRTLVARQKAADDKAKAELVAQLKTAQTEFTEAELNGMGVEELTRLSRVAKVETPDFSGRGLPRAASTDKDDVYANPPDPYALALAAQK